MSERQSKREQFNEKPTSGKKLMAPVAVLVLAVVVGSWFLFGPKSVGGPEVVSAGQDGMVSLAAADFNDGKARFFRFKGDSGTGRFLCRAQP